MQTYTVGIIVPHMFGSFNAVVMRGIHRQLAPSGRRTVTFQLTPGEIAAADLSSDHIQGWIAITMGDTLADLARSGTPLISICGAHPDSLCPRVLPENRASTREAIEHLIGHGHTQIAFIGFMANADHQERHQSYQETLRAHGIAPDPRLTMPLSNYLADDGAAAISELLRSGAPFSAVFVAHDLAAYGVLDALAQAGRRVPEDVAVVSFDDMPDSTYTDPPLTTIRQRADRLGEVAAQELLAVLDGAPMPESAVYVPTTLIVRRSCGCQGAESSSRPRVAADVPWRDRLAASLIRALIQPLPYDGGDPEQIWPGVAALIDAVDAAASGSPPAMQALRAPLQQAVQITADPHVLFQISQIIEAAAEERAADPETRGVAATFAGQVQHELVRQIFLVGGVASTYYRRLLEAETHVMRRLLETSDVNLQNLSWVAPTGIEWAILGLWVDQDTAPPQLAIAGSFSRSSSAAHQPRTLRASAFPLVAGLTDRIHGAATHVRVVPIRTSVRSWGLMAYAIPDGDPDYDGAIVWSTLIGLTLEREQLLSSVTESQATLQQAYARQLALTNTIRELGCPLIPLIPGVLLVPLIGAIDEERAQQILEQVLSGISAERADHVLIDITGVPLVDLQVAAALMRTAMAARMLGARVTLVGVRPEIAQSIVNLGIDLGVLATYPTLAAALQPLIQREQRRESSGDRRA
jgi:DNA-binding LacI/PurR family transcriptional regulator/anti-anti-sigma regulatory factor